VSLDISGLAFVLENIISSEIFDSLTPTVPRDSVTPRISKRAHDHPSRNYSGSGGHDPTDTEVSIDRRFTAIAGSQRACSLSENLTSTIWKYSPNLVESESLIFQPTRSTTMVNCGPRTSTSATFTFALRNDSPPSISIHRSMVVTI
jgi:hypothetical protein